MRGRRARRADAAAVLGARAAGRPRARRAPRSARGGVALDGSRVRVDAGDVHVDLERGRGRGRGVASTRAARAATCGRASRRACRRAARCGWASASWPIDARAVVDDTAGYHQRHTSWRWSAGVGRAVSGERVGWNLVTGVNDEPTRSERSVWVDGAPREVGPVRVRRRPLARRVRRGRRARLQRLGRARGADERAARAQRVPPAVRHVQRHAPGRHRARRGLRRDGVARRALVARGAAQSRASRWRFSSATSSFEWSAPIRSWSGSAPSSISATARSGSISPARRSISTCTSSFTSASSARL